MRLPWGQDQLRGQQVRLGPLQVVLQFGAAFHAAVKLFVDANIANYILKDGTMPKSNVMI